MATIRFNDALRLAAQAATASSLPPEWPVRVIRDIYGRLRFAIDCELANYPAEARAFLETAQSTFGAYATGDQLLFRDSFSDPVAVFNGADWHRTLVPMGSNEDGEAVDDKEIFLLDRQITGQDWLRPPTTTAAHPHRIVFFGLKGGVGRSTALTMVAWGLARQGKRVLLVDFDLESPGLSGLVLPAERIAEYGLVDWFVESAVGQGETVLGDMVSASPLAETTTGAIRVAAAMGQRELDYLAKLARAYADVPSAQGPQRMGARMRQVLELLEAQEEPDVVLIDSRAGLHDLAAVSITTLADTALLFATDSAQTWLGYRQLFAHWQRRPDVVTHIRDRLAIVRALTPRSDREGGVRRFQQAAYELFAETLYDDIPPSAEVAVTAEVDEPEYFHPSESDEAAPHFPILVDWDERFQEFDPSLRTEQGGVTEAQIEATFGGLIQWVTQRVSGGDE
jgi:cellulose biosynthesis protein BcsQ